MTVAQLITKLQTCNPNAIILTDKNGDVTIPRDTMGEAIVVATGVAYEVSCENNGNDYWITDQPWRHGFAGAQLNGRSSVYIGSGGSIVGPLWEKK